LAETLAARVSGRQLSQIRFYTGVPDANQDLRWHTFWTNKLRYLSNQGIYIYKGRINASGQEKGVDVSLAIDLVRLTYEQQYEVAVILSQDWDFGPAILLCKKIAQNQQRQLIFESHFPNGLGRTSRRGVPGTIWCPIDQVTYDSCHDPRNYQ
jgi:uncharacterized LabA/DUF88 family protein